MVLEPPLKRFDAVRTDEAIKQWIHWCNPADLLGLMVVD